MHDPRLTGDTSAPHSTNDGRLIIGVVVDVASVISGLARGCHGETPAPKVSEPPAVVAAGKATAGWTDRLKASRVSGPKQSLTP
jgi:hypothetical protein